MILRSLENNQSAKTLSPLEKWWRDFGKSPKTALNDLLLRRVYMGKLHRNNTAEIIFRLFHTKEQTVIQALDLEMRDWFKEFLTEIPSDISVSGWGEILENAFLTVDYLPLAETAGWLTGAYARARPYLRSLYLSSARDPEAAMLQTLALHQKNQDLLPVWMRLCGLEEELPFHSISTGLLGLRKLPDEHGEPDGDIPTALFRGIVRLAEAIDRQEHDKKERSKIWEMECRGIMAMYPRSDQYWKDNFIPLFEHNRESAALNWLGKIIPELPNKIKKQLQNNKRQTRWLQPPSYDELKKFESLIKKQPLNSFRTQLDAYLNRHRSYARQAGDSEFLVKTFSNFANKLFKKDSDLALGLAKEALLWAPYDSVVWGTLAKIEEHRGHYSRTLSLLWEAKRKFPEGAKIRASLADLLKRMGKLKIAETIYRQAMLDFPKNPVCRNGLAEVLKEQGKLEEAEKVYRQAMLDFPKNPVCRNGLAEVLKERGKLEEAEKVYRQAMLDFPEDAVCRNGLADILWMRHQDSEAISLLEGTLNNIVAKNLLDMIRRGPYDPDFLKKHGQEKKRDEIEFDWAGFQDPEFLTGLCGLYRQTDSQEEGNLDQVLTDYPGYLPAILEKGWWLADRSTGETEEFFSLQLKQHPHVLGLRLGELRSKGLTGEKADEQVWNDLTRDFSSRATVIKLEHVRQELPNSNGTRLKILEKLRSQLNQPSGHLPESVVKNEVWVDNTLRNTLFKGINLENKLKEEVLPRVSENFQEHEIRLRGMVEQCVNII